MIQTEENLKAYALYMRKYLEEYEKEGIKIKQIHVQNEVVADQKSRQLPRGGHYEWLRFLKRPSQ